jgi:ubiquinone/menaquinone biosynthesis C-methylase UbiE
MIVNSSDPGNIVLDLHCGSGTVAVCAKKLGRQFFCADIKAKYVNLARQRVANTQPPLPLVYPEQLPLIAEANDESIKQRRKNESTNHWR